MTKKPLIDEMAEKDELTKDRSKENCCAGSADPSPFEIWGTHPTLENKAIQELADWLYKYSAMFDYDNAALTDCVKVAKDIIKGKVR